MDQAGDGRRCKKGIEACNDQFDFTSVSRFSVSILLERILSKVCRLVDFKRSLPYPSMQRGDKIYIISFTS